jgi:hypothetical protein
LRSPFVISSNYDKTTISLISVKTQNKHFFLQRSFLRQEFAGKNDGKRQKAQSANFVGNFLGDGWGWGLGFGVPAVGCWCFSATCSRVKAGCWCFSATCLAGVRRRGFGVSLKKASNCNAAGLSAT